MQQLRHENLVNLIEVFCRKKHLYLVFEFVDHTVLDDLDQCTAGLDEDAVRRIMWQVLKGIHFCHVHNVSRLLNTHSTTVTDFDPIGRKQTNLA